jgi:transcriptional regulator GlxA family with amidase domain
MPPIRRILVVAVEGAESLDIMGPVEVFDYADRQVPGSYRIALRQLQAWIPGHLGEDLSVAALAARACLSERSFARAFRTEIGQTPAAYVETLRIERARALLEDGAESLEAVTRAAGFTSPEVLRRAFHRRVGVSPAAYRERFRLAA